MYQASLMTLLFLHSSNYATKMTYNRDKDIVFVHKPDGVWNDKEYVYEMHHLEHMVPSPVSGF